MPKPRSYSQWREDMGLPDRPESREAYDRYVLAVTGRSPADIDTPWEWLTSWKTRAPVALPTRFGRPWLAGDQTEAERAWAEAYAAAELADRDKKASAQPSWYAADDATANWFGAVNNSLLTGSPAPARPKPYDDLRTAGLTPEQQAIAALYDFVRETTYETLYGRPLPTTYTEELRALDQNVARAYNFILSSDASFKEAFRAYELMQQQPSKIPAEYRSPLFNAAMRGFSRGLAAKRDTITEQVFYTTPYDPTLSGTIAAFTAALDAPSVQKPVTAPDSGSLGQPAQIADQLRARDPDIARKVGGDGTGLMELAALIRNPSFNANQARTWDALYDTNALSDWYAFYVGSPGFVSDTQSPQSVREMVSEALTHLTGILSLSQRRQLEANGSALAAMWRDEMARFGAGTAAFASQSRFDRWLVANVDRIAPELDLEIASKELEVSTVKAQMTPIQRDLLDMGVSPKAAVDLSGVMERQPGENYRDYMARLGGVVEQLMEVGKIAYARDPAKYAEFRNSYIDTEGRGDVLGEVQIGKVFRRLLPNIDPILWDIINTAAAGNDELANAALSTSDPAVLRAAISRFGRTKELRAPRGFGPPGLEGAPISFELADDPRAAELPTEFLDALHSFAVAQTASLPEGVRDIAVSQIMGKALRYYSAFGQAEKLRLAALPEAQQPFGGIPKDEFTQIIASTESMKAIDWFDPRIFAEERAAVESERGLSGISNGNPEDIVDINGTQRRRQDVVNELGETAKARALARQRQLIAAGGPAEITDAAGATRRTPLGNLQYFLEAAGRLADPRAGLEAARQRFAGKSAAQFAPKFFAGFGLVARRRADSIIPDFDLELGAAAATAAPSQRFETSTFSPRRRA